MNDRDFKLLVREYFLAESIKANSVKADVVSIAYRKSDELRQRILSELELFTKKDVEELPFKEKI